MSRLYFRIAALFALAVLALVAPASTEVRAQTPALDPSAIQILQKMTGYLGSLPRFSVHTQNTLEDVLASGHRVDFDVSASVTIGRPNRLRAERRGDLIDQIFFYDGETLTLYNPADKVYATEPAPGTIEEVLDFARESLGLMIPAADLVYRNAFPLLMQDVTLAKMVGKAVIGGVKCDHLLFSRPGVDFQVYVNTGRRCGVLLLWRKFLPCGISGQQAGLCNGPAEMKATGATIGAVIHFEIRKGAIYNKRLKFSVGELIGNLYLIQVFRGG